MTRKTEYRCPDCSEYQGCRNHKGIPSLRVHDGLGGIRCTGSKSPVDHSTARLAPEK